MATLLSHSAQHAVGVGDAGRGSVAAYAAAQLAWGGNVIRKGKRGETNRTTVGVIQGGYSVMMDVRLPIVLEATKATRAGIS